VCHSVCDTPAQYLRKELGVKPPTPDNSNTEKTRDVITSYSVIFNFYVIFSQANKSDKQQDDESYHEDVIIVDDDKKTIECNGYTHDVCHDSSTTKEPEVRWTDTDSNGVVALKNTISAESGDKLDSDDTQQTNVTMF
jgi:hypothetical protein